MNPQRSLVFLNRFYWPDHSATAQMLADLTEDLAATGWDVSVITSRARYDGEGDAGPTREVRRGVKVFRVGSSGGSRHSTVGRIAGYLRYVAGAARMLLFSSRWTAVVAMSDPPLLVVLATWIARLRRRRTVYWVQDVFPLIAVRLGVIQAGGLPSRALAAFGERANKRCDLVIALGDRMRDEMIAQGCAPQKTVVVHNWADGDLVRPASATTSRFFQSEHLRDKFVVMYSGNAGRAHPLEGVIEAAARMPDRDAYAFVFIGGGARTDSLRALSDRIHAPVIFRPYVARSDLADSLSAASVSIIAEDPAVAGLLVPSKVYGILASGRPILFLGDQDSDVARLVRQGDCGWILDPSDIDGLVEKIAELRRDAATTAVAGARARSLFESNYTRRIATKRWEAAAETLVRL